MVIVLNVSFPAESAKKMGESFTKAPPIPDYLTRRGPYISSNNKDGIRSLSIFEVDSDKLADGLLAVGDYVAGFFDVPGFAYEAKVNNEVQEALKMIGLG